MQEVTLRELHMICGVSRREVQGYEKFGLVRPSGKTSLGYLLYDSQTQKQVSKRCKNLSACFTLPEHGVNRTDDSPHQKCCDTVNCILPRIFLNIPSPLRGTDRAKLRSLSA